VSRATNATLDFDGEDRLQRLRAVHGVSTFGFNLIRLAPATSARRPREEGPIVVARPDRGQRPLLLPPMATTDQSAKTAALEAQVAQLQRELAEQAARAGAAVAAAQERPLQLAAEHAAEMARANAKIAELEQRLYWLDRWQLDLNELMRRRGANELRAVARAARAVLRFVKRLRRRLSS
jgi:hypothetical protein